MSKIIQRDSTEEYASFELPEVGEVRQKRGLPTADEIESIQQQAYDEGFAQGQKAGMATGKAQVDKQITRLHSILNVLAQPLDELDEQVVQQITDLSIIVARQLIRRELRTDPGQVIAVVRECAKAIPVASQQVNLYLHPDDAELVRSAFSLDHEAESRWKIIEEPVLTRGGCRIEAEHSKIDATVENRLNQIITNFLGGEREDDRVDS
ncbi:MAG: flagellar assembly protein FliH [Gammaproteobacteria bacterium]